MDNLVAVTQLNPLSDYVNKPKHLNIGKLKLTSSVINVLCLENYYVLLRKKGVLTCTVNYTFDTLTFRCRNGLRFFGIV